MPEFKHGKFHWFELMTSDTDAATPFYERVVGWKATPWEADPSYKVMLFGESAAGGIRSMPPEAAAAGTPPHWLAFVEVSDIAAVAEKVQAKGGTVLVPPTDIPPGRFCVFKDPQGAAMGAIQPNETSGPDHNTPGFFTWAELYTSDPDAAWAFYSDLFEWHETSSMESPAGPYRMYSWSGLDRSMGGFCSNQGPMSMPTAWVFYVTVADLDAALENVAGAGGQVVMGPMDVPGGDRIAQCLDPQGAAFALHQLGQNN